MSMIMYFLKYVFYEPVTLHDHRYVIPLSYRYE